MTQRKFITRKHLVGGRTVYTHQSRVTGGMFVKSTNLGKKVIVSSGAKPQQMTTQVILEEARPKTKARDSRLVRPIQAARVGGSNDLLAKIQAAFASKKR